MREWAFLAKALCRVSTALLCSGVPWTHTHICTHILSPPKKLFRCLFLNVTWTTIFNIFLPMTHWSLWYYLQSFSPMMPLLSFPEILLGSVAVFQLTIVCSNESPVSLPLLAEWRPMEEEGQIIYYSCPRLSHNLGFNYFQLLCSKFPFLFFIF